MEVATVEINGSVSDIKRAVSSAKDVLHGIPRHDEEERPASVKICADGPLKVEEGPKRVLPGGEYLLEDVKYKYVVVRHDGDEYKVEIDSSVSKIKVLTGS